jgi:hypothetical protein
LQTLALNFTQLGGAYGPYGPLGFIGNWSLFDAGADLVALGDFANASILLGGGPFFGAANIANLSIPEMLYGIGAYADAIAKWGEEYDGTILEREVWDYLDPAEEFDPNDPDTDDDEVPFLLDPRDWHNAYMNARGYFTDIYSELESIQQYWGWQTGWWAALAGGCAQIYAIPSRDNFTAYEAVNTSIYEQLLAITDPVVQGTLMFLMNTPSDIGDILTGVPNFGLGVGNYTTDWVLGLWAFVDTVIETTIATYQGASLSKFGYLLSTLEAGQPCCGPDSASFIKRAIKEFNIRKGPYKIPWLEYGKDLNLDGSVSAVEYGAKSPNTGQDLGGETIYIYAEVDIEVDDAGTVTIEFEYLDDQIDPRDDIRLGGDGEDELEDWEWQVYSVSDQPNIMKDGDTIFWQSDPIEAPIPGYETPIIIGVSLVSVIGLIYVVMKKRKR